MPVSQIVDFGCPNCRNSLEFELTDSGEGSSHRQFFIPEEYCSRCDLWVWYSIDALFREEKYDDHEF